MKNLLEALARFGEGYLLSFEESISWITRLIAENRIDEKGLKEEYLSAMEDENFDWISFSKECDLLVNPEIYTNIELKNYVRSLLEDYLFPEKVLTEEQINKLGLAVLDILKKKKDWVFSYDLYDELIKQKGFENMEYYHLWSLPFTRLNIKRKKEKEKDMEKEIELGYLKYVGQ